MSGDYRLSQSGIYNSMGATGPENNKPGARDSPISWSDTSGNLWLFGGSGFAQGSTGGYLNDLWKYNITTGQWTWMSGNPVPDQPGVYGVRGVASASNKPGARWRALSWADNAGNLWLFGGQGYAASGSGYLNDLWKYNIATGLWTWVSGDAMPNQSGVYGIKGIAGAANKPGARHVAVGGMDAAGNLWLFGGSLDRAHDRAQLNDLWKYNLSADQWTWVSGDSLLDQPSVYGSRGIADAVNKPGARSGAAGWLTPSGDFWLFSGRDNKADLWKYTISTGLWTWMGGDTTQWASGVYGSKGIAAATNQPGGRSEKCISLIDASGNLLLFGGEGFNSSKSIVFFNDLWQYSPASGLWTWISCDSVGSQSGDYGAKGIAAPTNKPGGRIGPVGWLDPSGYFWVFGGIAVAYGVGSANDLWRYTLTPTTVLSIANGFTAKRELQTVMLNWTANKDQNIRSFVVERSSGNGVYDSIGSVVATGMLTQNARYSFVDRAPLSGTNFYRIKQISPVGSATYTAVARVLMETNAMQFSVVQNPVRGKLQLSIQLPEAQKLTLDVRDMNGQLLLRQEENGYQGTAVYEVGVDRLAKGTYLIRLTTGTKTETKKFIKQ